MKRVIVDTNIWSVLAKAGRAREVFDLAQSSRVEIVMPPSILLEVLRTKDSELRHKLTDALRAGRSTKLRTEAQLEMAELIAEVRRCRPEWLRQIPNTGSVAGFETFWTKTVWRYTHDEYDDMAARDPTAADAQVTVAMQKENRRRWLEEKFPAHEFVRAGLTMEWEAAPDWYLDVVPEGQQIDHWRLIGIMTSWREFFEIRGRAVFGGHPSTFVDWASAYIDLDRMTRDRTSFVKFWVGDAEVSNFRRLWIRATGDLALNQSKVTDGHPYDGQHMVYLPDCDLFLTADKRLASAIDRIGEIAPFRLPPWGRVKTPTGDTDATLDSIESHFRTLG